MKVLKYITYVISLLITFGLIAHFAPYYSEVVKSLFYDFIENKNEWYFKILIVLEIIILYLILFICLAFVSSSIYTMVRIIKKKLNFDIYNSEVFLKINKTTAILGIIALTINYWGLMYLLYQGFDFWYFLNDFIVYLLLSYSIYSVALLLNKELE